MTRLKGSLALLRPHLASKLLFGEEVLEAHRPISTISSRRRLAERMPALGTVQTVLIDLVGGAKLPMCISCQR